MKLQWRHLTVIWRRISPAALRRHLQWQISQPFAPFSVNFFRLLINFCCNLDSIFVHFSGCSHSIINAISLAFLTQLLIKFVVNYDYCFSQFPSNYLSYSDSIFWSIRLPFCSHFDSIFDSFFDRFCFIYLPILNSIGKISSQDRSGLRSQFDESNLSFANSTILNLQLMQLMQLMQWMLSRRVSVVK